MRNSFLNLIQSMMQMNGPYFIFNVFILLFKTQFIASKLQSHIPESITVSLMFLTVCSYYNIVKPLKSGHLPVFKNLSVIEKCPLLGGNLKKIVTFGTKCFVRYSWHVGYLECPLLGGFTVFILYLKTKYSIDEKQFEKLKV